MAYSSVPQCLAFFLGSETVHDIEGLQAVILEPWEWELRFSTNSGVALQDPVCVFSKSIVCQPSYSSWIWDLSAENPRKYIPLNVVGLNWTSLALPDTFHVLRLTCIHLLHLTWHAGNLLKQQHGKTVDCSGVCVCRWLGLPFFLLWENSSICAICVRQTMHKL